MPEVNTVLFLRPTESPTVFLQQLGRAVRRSRPARPAAVCSTRPGPGGRVRDSSPARKNEDFELRAGDSLITENVCLCHRQNGGKTMLILLTTLADASVR